MPKQEMYICPICGRQHTKEHMTYHHLFPVFKGQKKGKETIYICETCHLVIHFCYPNKILRNYYNNIDRILKSKKIQIMLQLYKYKSDNCVFRIKYLKRRLKVAS